MSASNTTVTISAIAIQTNGGSVSYSPSSMVNSYSVGQSYEQALTPTPVLITLPAHTQWFAVIPPPSNSVGLHHKWAAGDTGSLVNPAYGIPCLAVEPSSLTFYLWSDSNITVQIISG
jgi:hypothetical protein